MKNSKTEYPIMVLREDLRLRASEKANRISRSVVRLTSCDRLPCPEYPEEVSYEFQLAQELFYLQNCRSALEKCIESGSSVLRHRKTDGSVTVTRFRMVGPSRVRVWGLQSA